MAEEVIDGKYQVIRQLGRGGMGVVLEAVHLATGRRVAVKLIVDDEQRASAESVTRFQRETRVVGGIDSRHVVQVLDGGVDAATGNPYMVMELLAGEDLLQLVRRQRALTPELAVRIGAQACAGLQRAHEAGITHRDIKSANLFLARVEGDEVIVKILDFGIAKLRNDAATRQNTGMSLTQTGTVLGSPMYMSPEQAMGTKDTDARSDLWSLGVVLYEVLCGRTPHADCPTMGALIVAICTQPPRPLTQIAPWIPAPVAAVVHRALSIDPAQRFQSAAEMRAELNAFLPGGAGLHVRMLDPAPAAVERPESLRPLSTGAPWTSGSVPRVTPHPTLHPAGTAAWNERAHATAQAPYASMAQSPRSPPGHALDTPPAPTPPPPKPKRAARWGAIMASLPAVVGLVAEGFHVRSVYQQTSQTHSATSSPLDVLPGIGLGPAAPTSQVAPAEDAAPSPDPETQARHPVRPGGPGHALRNTTTGADTTTGANATPKTDQRVYAFRIGEAGGCPDNTAVCMGDCNSGRTEACLILAELYEKGLRPGEPPDYEEALKYYKHGCAGGEPKACAAVTRLQAQKPSNQAHEQYRIDQWKKHCQGADVTDCTFLGMAYEFGHGVPQSNATAIEYYRRGCDAADTGDCMSQKRLEGH